MKRGRDEISNREFVFWFFLFVGILVLAMVK